MGGEVEQERTWFRLVSHFFMLWDEFVYEFGCKNNQRVTSGIIIHLYILCTYIYYIINIHKLQKFTQNL